MSFAQDPQTGLVFEVARIYKSTSSPTSSSDANTGVSVGDIWINTGSGGVYICTSTAIGSAVWFNTNSMGTPLTLTDGTHTVANVGTITVSGATVGGTSPAATLVPTAVPLTVTDGTHTVANTGTLTVAGTLTVSGTTPSATVTGT
jgi:hypothetical protein